MKKLYLLLIPLLLFIDAGAQTYFENYNILSLNAGSFFSNHPGHDITTSFPFTTTSLTTGGVTQQTFSGSLHSKFTSPAYMIGPNLELIRHRNGIDLGLGYFRENGGDHGLYLKTGYSYSLSLGGLLLKPGMGLFYLIGTDRMGSIDNSGKQIDVLGHFAGDTFSVNVDDGNGGTYEETYSADRLDVNYERYTLLANPKLILSTRPKGKLVFSLELGWMVQLTQKCVFQLDQVNESSHNSNSIGHVPLDKNGSLSGAYAAINLGICIK